MPSINYTIENAIAARIQFFKDLLPSLVDNPSFAANVEYGTDFYKTQEDGRTNYSYKLTATDEPATFNFIGEILKNHGTVLGPMGNVRLPTHGEDQELIFDGTRLKNLAAIGMPSHVQDEVKRFIHNQLTTIENAIALESVDKNPDTVPFNTDLCIIRIHFPKRYQATVGNYTKPQVATRKKVNVTTGRLTSESSDDPAVENGINHSEGMSVNPVPVVELNGLYDPQLQEPYDRNIFRLINDKLKQHDVRDIDNNLIPAWKLQEGLPPGTVVLVNASLQCFNIGSRRYYQLLANKVKVLCERIPTLQDLGEVTETASDKQAKTQANASTEFESFAQIRKDAARKGPSVEPEPKRKQATNISASSNMSGQPNLPGAGTTPNVTTRSSKPATKSSEKGKTRGDVDMD